MPSAVAMYLICHDRPAASTRITRVKRHAVGKDWSWSASRRSSKDSWARWQGPRPVDAADIIELAVDVDPPT